MPDLTARATLIAAVREGLSYPETQARVRALLAPPASEVSLYKDSHDRQPDGDHAGAAEGTSAAQPTQASNTHDRLPTGDDVPTVSDPAIVFLNARERAPLSGLGNKLEQWIENPARLAAADWEALAPIALHFRDLLRHMHET